MAKSALLKSSIVKKYWMALTGLFLCLFLAGHLAGNLQLIFGTSLQFNEYALFMTTNPAVKLLSYLTYISIIFHAIDGIMLTIQNKKALTKISAFLFLVNEFKTPWYRGCASDCKSEEDRSSRSGVSRLIC